MQTIKFVNIFTQTEFIENVSHCLYTFNYMLRTSSASNRKKKSKERNQTCLKN